MRHARIVRLDRTTATAPSLTGGSPSVSMGAAGAGLGDRAPTATAGWDSAIWPDTSHYNGDRQRVPPGGAPDRRHGHQPCHRRGVGRCMQFRSDPAPGRGQRIPRGATWAADGQRHRPHRPPGSRGSSTTGVSAPASHAVVIRSSAGPTTIRRPGGQRVRGLPRQRMQIRTPVGTRWAPTTCASPDMGPVRATPPTIAVEPAHRLQPQRAQRTVHWWSWEGDDNTAGRWDRNDEKRRVARPGATSHSATIAQVDRQRRAPSASMARRPTAARPSSAARHRHVGLERHGRRRIPSCSVRAVTTTPPRWWTTRTRSGRPAALRRSWLRAGHQRRPDQRHGRRRRHHGRRPQRPGGSP